MCSQIYSVLPRYLSIKIKNLHPFSCKFWVILVRFLCTPPPPPPPPPRNEVSGVYWIHPVCPAVCLSGRLSVWPLTFRVRPVASTVQDGFFLYLVQMINSMRGCVACVDPWPWPISLRSFGLNLENRVRSLASTVLDGFFLYLAQMITIIRGCVACYIFRIWKFEFLANLWKFFGLHLEKILQFSKDSFHIYHKWPLVWEGVLHIMTFDLDLYLRGHLALVLKIVSLCSIYSSWWILSIFCTNDQ